ncbi:MFS transporter [Streptomyces sp. NPDC052114]|uniref:MFS transporter n=1 Tax=unclassified Streptomyces TaxID=2593676 RepID=UPI003422380C
MTPSSSDRTAPPDPVDRLEARTSRQPLTRNRGFKLLWASETISHLGSAVTLVALPLLAVVTLHASPFEVGLLVAAENLAWLLIGLPAGAWVDRWPKRTVAVATDWARAALLTSIPVAALAGMLTMTHLYVVAVAVGVAGVFFAIAYQALLPSLVHPDDLVTANGRLQVSQSSAMILGPGLGGGLVQLATAAGAIALDALSFAVSALLLSRTRPKDRNEGQATPAKPARPATAGKPTPRPPLRTEVSEGLRYVLGDRRLRALTLCGAQFNFFVAAQQAVAVLFLVREVGLSAGWVGALLATSGAGGILAATFSGRLVARYGPGPTMTTALTCGTALGLLIPLASPGAGITLFAIGYAALSGGIVVFGVVFASYRQSVCPPALLGRMTATVRLFSWGALSVGGVTGGVLAQFAGLRGALWAVAIGFALCPLWVFLGGARHLPTPPGQAAD